MTELIPWIHDEINRMRRDMDHLLNQCWPDIGADLVMGGFSGGLSLEISQSDDALTIKAVVPGVDPEDLEVFVADDKLTIKGCKKETSVEEGGYYQRVEKKLRSFCRSVPLPNRALVSEIKATLHGGVLRVVVPRWKPRETRLIQVEID